MPLTFFTVTGDFKSVTADLPTDSDYNPEVGGHLTATVTFTPLITKGEVLVVDGVGYLVAPVVGIIQQDGKLVLRSAPDPGGTGTFAPVRLLAHQDSLNLMAPLSYSVEFTDVKLDGRPWQIKAFTFHAPTSGELNLVNVVPVAGFVASQHFTIDWSQITNKPTP